MFLLMKEYLLYKISRQISPLSDSQVDSKVLNLQSQHTRSLVMYVVVLMYVC